MAMNLNREDEFLKDQANEAWSAMGNTFAQAAHEMHPRHWKARTWWIALGATATAGIVIAVAATRRHTYATSHPSSAPPAPKRHRISGMVKLVLELAALARPLLESVLAGFVAHNSDDGAPKAGEPASPPPRSA